MIPDKFAFLPVICQALESTLASFTTAPNESWEFTTKNGFILTPRALDLDLPFLGSSQETQFKFLSFFYVTLESGSTQKPRTDVIFDF